MDQKNEPKLTVTIQQEITFTKISDLLTSAFEGGSNYWISRAKKVKPVQWDFHSFPDLGRKSPEDPPSVYLCDYPLNPGGKIVITINEPFDDVGTTEYTLDLPKIKKGLELFVKDGGFGNNADGTPKLVPHHAANFLKDDGDAETGDVFLQICLFGEVIFG